jgi:hypothetical protein
MQSPIIKQMTAEIDYDAIFKWTEHSKLIDLIRKIQSELSSNPPIEKTEIDRANSQLE